ncbi:MAG: DUF6765 family protein [Planctomycetota bacterium]|jgi:hypothetical protein
MQKDVHYSLTYALALAVGIDDGAARQIAWADQRTDELTSAELHGIQTQSAKLGNWGDRQVQATVLVPFHFLPGGEGDNPWAVVADNKLSMLLVTAAGKSGNRTLRLGIALHALQDTFSHQNFTGWNEKYNSCFPWYYVQSGLPNVGHAEMRAVPDIISAEWTDPRTGEKIDNRERTLACARATHRYLWGVSPSRTYDAKADEDWQKLESGLREIIAVTGCSAQEEYMERKYRIETFYTEGKQLPGYQQTDAEFREFYHAEFVQAARGHLAAAMQLMKGLPAAEGS